MIGSLSRYNYSSIVQVIDSTGQLAEREHPDIRPQLQNIVHSDNQEYTPSDTDNWSRIGWRKLGDGKHWWIIADYSEVIDPFTELRSQERLKYATQLSVAAPVATMITEITVVRPKEVRRGDVLRIEDLDPAHAVSFDVTVLSTNETLGTVQFAPTMTPAGGVPILLSRVSRVYRDNIRLVVPSVHRAYFEAMNFTNPLNTLTE